MFFHLRGFNRLAYIKVFAQLTHVQQRKTCATTLIYSMKLDAKNDNLCIDQSINYVSLLYIIHLDDHHHRPSVFHFLLCNASLVSVSSEMMTLWIYG